MAGRPPRHGTGDLDPGDGPARVPQLGRTRLTPDGTRLRWRLLRNDPWCSSGAIQSAAPGWLAPRPPIAGHGANRARRRRARDAAPRPARPVTGRGLAAWA